MTSATGAERAGAAGASTNLPLEPTRAGVSVVIPHHGPVAPTAVLVETLLAVSEPHLQVIVVDDASPVPFPDRDGVEVVRRSTNGGFGAAVNTGAERATQPLLLVLNSDVVLDEGFVAALVDAAEPWQPAVVGPLVLDGTGAPAPSARRFPSVTQQAVEWLAPLARWRSTPAVRWAVGHDPRCLPGTVRSADWLIGACLLLPTDELRAVGGFDPGYFMNVEEVDLQRRLRARGVPSIFAGTVALTHRGGGSSDPGRSRTWLVAARLRDARMHGGRATVTRLRAALALASLVNYASNRVRQAAGRPVDAGRQLRDELRLVRLPAVAATPVPADRDATT